MKKNNLVFAVILSAVIIAIGSIAVGFAEDSAAGTAADPVVTKSYVDKALEKLEEKLSLKSASEDTDTADKPETAVSSGWEAIFVEKNKTVLCGAGTQVILRSGNSKVYDETVNGLSDLTAGKGIYSGDSMVRDHLVLVPRADGRGIVCTTDCWIMICGAYEIK